MSPIWTTGEIPTATKMNLLGWAATYGTTPPGSPNDGDLWLFPADATNGVMWLFRYRAASASAYKWEFVGGPALNAYIATSETTTTTGSYVNLATVGPTLVVPRAGDYDVGVGAQMYGSAANGILQACVGIGDFTSPLVSALGNSAAAIYLSTPWAQGRLTALAASTSLRMKYQQNLAGTLTVEQRRLWLWPVRVS